MSEKRIGLVLSVGRLWVMSLPFRLACRSSAPGFRPGVRNLVVYELRHLWHLIYERERLAYNVGGLRAFFKRIGLRR
jgi:hypothetical protein